MGVAPALQEVIYNIVIAFFFMTNCSINFNINTSITKNQGRIFFIAKKSYDIKRKKQVPN